MRTLFAVVVAVVVAVGLAACTRSNGLYIGSGSGSDGAAASDLASADFAGDDLKHERDGGGGGGTVDLSQPPVDLAGGGPVCVSICNHCTSGACCPGGKNGCCGPGEYCDGTGRCRCGQGDACSGGLMCSSGGPITGGGQCGSVCCGDITHPCPL